MKKRLFFYVAGIVALIAGAISCTNNDFEESIPQEQPQRTRAVRTMTADEVQARLDELNEKYNSNFIIVSDISSEEYDDFYFTALENVMRRNAGLEPLYIEEANTYDYSIDEVAVASTGRSLENDAVADPNEIYYGSATSYEGLQADQYTGFISEFNIYSYSISYNFQYGRNSVLTFSGFGNQTVYTIDNMPKNGVNEFLLPEDVANIAKNYGITYIDQSLRLETGISYDPDEPENLERVKFGYSYQFTISNKTFEAVSSNNSYATAIRAI